MSLISVGLFVAKIATATTYSVLIPAATATNLTLVPGAAKITQIIASCQGTNLSTFYIYDSPSNSFLYTNSAYSNILSYATNYVNTYTNYYGVTNITTNLNLVDITNSVAATTNTFPLRISASIPSNSVATIFSGVNYYFTSGAWATNSGSGAVTLTVTYQQ